MAGSSSTSSDELTELVFRTACTYKHHPSAYFSQGFVSTVFWSNRFAYSFGKYRRIFMVLTAADGNQ
jgi:hypothetical protein